MSFDAQPRWFDSQAIGRALERDAAPDSAELLDILNKSLELQLLSIEETVALMRVQDGVGIGRIQAGGQHQGSDDGQQGTAQGGCGSNHGLSPEGGGAAKGRGCEAAKGFFQAAGAVPSSAAKGGMVRP